MAFSSWLIIAYIVTTLGVIGTVLSENRNPLKASAWILIIGLIPVVGIMTYIVFGQDQRRLHSISRRFYRRLMRRPQQLSLPKHLQRKRQITEEHLRLIELIQRNSNTPLLQLQSLEIYAWGADMYEALFHDLEQAEEYIHLQAYIFGADAVLDRLTDLLIRKAKEGVTIRIIYDHLGSYNVPKAYWQRMRSAGIQVYAFMRVAFPLHDGELPQSPQDRHHRRLYRVGRGDELRPALPHGQRARAMARHPLPHHGGRCGGSAELLPHRLVHRLTQGRQYGSLL